MLYTAYLLICMASPIGGEYCTPAVKPLTFDTERQCKVYLQQERQHLKGEANLEAYRPHLPSMVEGKLLLKWRCASPIEKEWLGRDMPKHVMEKP
jgi:hypothetical protein